MGFKDLLSKEHVADGVKKLKKLQPKIDHSSLLTVSALLLILFTAFAIRLFPIRWEIQTGSLHLSEFDPYFQYRFTENILKKGIIPLAWSDQWWDPQRWYPDGINMADRGFVGLPLTTAVLYSLISALGVNIPLMDFCSIFPAIMGMFASLVIYFLGKDIGGRPVGLFASLFLALSPSYLQRTSLGFFDDETIGIVALVLFSLLFLRSTEKNRPLDSTIKYSLASGIALGYFCSAWGAAYYPIGVVLLFTFLLILLKRYSQRLLLSYSLTFGLGLFIAINVPKLTSTYLTTSVILPVAGVFLLLCLSEVSRVLTSTKWKAISIIALLTILILAFSVIWQLGYMRGIAGKFLSVINPVLRGGSPLIESVAEHRISSWGSIYYEFGIMIIFFMASFYFMLRNFNDKNLFLLILGVTSLYFACSMVRLLVLMAPIFSLLAAYGTTRILKPFNTLLREPPRTSAKGKYGLQYVGKEFSGTAVFLIFLILMTHFAFPMPKVYSQAWAPVTITASSLPIAPQEPVREWLDMLQWTKNNLEATTVVSSWWDYGYWLTIMGNVTSLADNATINTTQIQNIGFSFMANETQSIKMLEKYDAEYVLVYTTFAVGESEGQIYAYWAGYGDEGKWMWMARISGTARERFINDGFIDRQLSWTNETSFGNYNSSTNRWEWNVLGMNSTIYKLMAWGKQLWCQENGAYDLQQGYWSAINFTIEDIRPKYFEKAYFSGLDISPDEAGDYGNLVPMICLYKIDWDGYYSDYPERARS